MKYNYIVKTTISRFNEIDKENYNIETITNEFSSINPFTSREAAFERAKSYDDEFIHANEIKTDNFFSSENNWYNEYSISIFFIDPTTKKELEIHNSLSIEENQTRCKAGEIYDPIYLRWILSALEKEFNILKNTGVSIDKAKNIEITFTLTNEIIKTTIFPTDWLNKERITVEDIVL